MKLLATGAVVLGLVLTSIGEVRAEKITDEEVQAVAAASDAFGCDLYGQLRDAKPDANAVFSPFSLSTALNMAALGARGQTAQEFTKVLHQTDSPNFHGIVGGLARGFQKSKDYTLVIDNNLWLQQGATILPEFSAGLKDFYRAPATPLDFADEPKARGTINDAVAKSTEGRIKDLVPARLLDENTRFVLTNAIYFRGAWENAFAKEATHDADFALTPQKKIKVSMMSQASEAGAVRTADYSALEIPYKGKGLAMLILIPRDGKTLADVEKNLTPAELKELGANIAYYRLIFNVPRFKITSQFDLRGALAKAGMKNAFGAEADFSGINGRKDLFISAVLHKAYVDVNEEGTEAAAASAVAGALKSAGGERPTVVTIDRPFVWMIVERNSRLIFFMGRVMDPTKG